MQEQATSVTHPFSAFVYIIESPSPEDLFDGRTEGKMLVEALHLAEVRTRYRLASSMAIFDRCLGPELAAAVTYYQAFPILHISAHDTAEGFRLTDDSFLSWDQFRARLVSVNRALRGGLVLCMSSCFGATGCRMAMRENEPLPFLAMLGHFGSPTWSDAAVAFVAFYHRLFKGASVDESIAAMKQASGDEGFLIQYGQRIQQSWVQFIQQKRLELLRALQDLGSTAGVAGQSGSSTGLDGSSRQPN